MKCLWHGPSQSVIQYNTCYNFLLISFSFHDEFILMLYYCTFIYYLYFAIQRSEYKQHFSLLSFWNKPKFKSRLNLLYQNQFSNKWIECDNKISSIKLETPPYDAIESNIGNISQSEFPYKTQLLKFSFNIPWFVFYRTPYTYNPLLSQNCLKFHQVWTAINISFVNVNNWQITLNSNGIDAFKEKF